MPAVPRPRWQCHGDATNDLHLAARDGSIERTIALLSRGSLDIDQRTPEEGYTPLMVAAMNRKSSIARILLNKGADVSVVDEDGSTALHQASNAGHVEVVTALVKAGADIEATTSSGLTPIHLAAGFGHLEVVKELVKAGAALQEMDSSGYSPLLWAVAGEHLEVVTALVEAGADLNATDSIGLTPLHLAAKNGHLAVMQALMIDRASYVNTRGSFGETPLRVAITFGRCSPRAVRLLVDAGADTTLGVRVTGDHGAVVSDETPLETTTRCLRSERVAGKDATEEQLHRLEGIRRLLLRVEVVHAVSWLWHNDVPIGRTPGDSKWDKAPSIPPRVMLPSLRRRAGRRGVVLGSLFRSVGM